MKVNIHELQALRKDGAIEHYRIENQAQLNKVFSYLSGFYFGHEVKPKAKEELESLEKKKEQ